MEGCRVCGKKSASEAVITPACGCTGGAHTACLAKLANHRATTAGCYKGWASCTVCGKPFKNGRLVEVMLRLWSKTAKSLPEKIAFYAACGKLMLNNGKHNPAVKAFRNQLLAHKKHGDKMSSSKAMFDAMIRYGVCLAMSDKLEHAANVFHYAANKSQSPHAWQGFEHLANVLTKLGHYTRAKVEAAHALKFDGIDANTRARIEQLHARLCLLTHDYCAAATIAEKANQKAWKAVSTFTDPVAFVKAEAEAGINLFAPVVSLQAPTL